MSATVETEPVTAATAGHDEELSSVRADALALAAELGEISRSLKAALDDKARLTRLLDEVLECLDTAVVLQGADGRVLAANGSAQRMGVVERGPAGLVLAPGLLETCSDERPFRPHGLKGPTWTARRASVPLPGGGEGGLLAIQDVTRAVRLEEQSGRRTRLEALGRMAAEIAHEVRNPLGSLELFGSLLVDELADRPDSRELAEQILLGVRHLSGTVTRLLAAVRGRPLARRVVDVSELCREVCAALDPVALSRGVRLDPPRRDELVAAALDGEGIRQALLNLVGNALEFTPEDGTIAVRACRRRGDVVLEVADTGPGVPRELRERIFEPFFTTRTQGTGLGLAVVERIALAHGGAVELEDAPDGGALFRVILPDSREELTP